MVRTGPAPPTLPGDTGVVGPEPRPEDPRPSGGEGEAPELSEDAVTLRVTWWGGDSRHPLTQSEALFSDGGVSISPETLAAYFQQALDWTKSGAAASASHQAELAGASIDQSDFSTHKQALLFSQITQIPAYEAATGGATLEPVKIPTEDANEADYSYLKPGMYWSVSSTSEHPAEAALFVDFMVNDPEAGHILQTDRGIPSNGAVRDTIIDGLEPGQKRAADFVAAEEQYIGKAPEITPNGASELDKLIARYLQDVLFESQTPQEAADAFIAELDSSIQSANP
jgi:multiple sugar transport system substrate-binding protein